MNNNKANIIKEIPFFSIGITTYNRNNLLKQTLESLIDQDFTDFEIIIGNDYLNEVLTHDIIGILDTRIRIINNQQNLGELDNMNSLLGYAEGKYFTWIFDDDLCAPSFLKEVYSSLIRFDNPLSVYTSFKYFYGVSNYKFKKISSPNHTLYSGNDFLKKYLLGRIRTLGVSGFHNTEYLRANGGAQRLSKGHMALYSEYLLIIRDGLLQKIAYINAPLIRVRFHNNSFSISNSNIALFKEAGLNLLKESIEIFSRKELQEEFQNNLTSLLKSVISVIFVKSSIGLKRLKNNDINDYLTLIKTDLKLIENPILYKKALICLDNSIKSIPLFILKARSKELIPERYLYIVHFMQYILSRFTYKSF